MKKQLTQGYFLKIIVCLCVYFCQIVQKSNNFSCKPCHIWTFLHNGGHSVLFVTPVLLQTCGFCFKFGFIILCSSVAPGSQARSTHQAAREAWPGGHRPGPAGCPRVAQSPPHERDHCESTAICLFVFLIIYKKNFIYIAIFEKQVY